jgi:cytoskeletal protein CcmA (bactofilin family)
MKFEKFLKMAAPMVALAVAAGMTSGCNGEFKINDSDGVPLSELDLAGKAPDKLVLMGSDTIRVTAGDALKIELEGSESAKANMRFVLDSDSLAVLREGGIDASAGRVTVHVTMPAPREIVVGGSGTVHADALAKDAEISIGGSGSVEAPKIAVDSLEVTIAGSGDVRAGGTARDLEISLVGSGDADMPGLKADKAEVSIAGSGSATFASDGEVRADIMGSGNVTVRGGARCRVKAIGSGTLTCERGATVE